MLFENLAEGGGHSEHACTENLICFILFSKLLLDGVEEHEGGLEFKAGVC